MWRGSENLAEQANSPMFNLGDALSAEQQFRGPYDLCVRSAPFKGTLISISGVLCRVSNSRVTREKGGVGLLVITCEVADPQGLGSGQELPESECEIDFDESTIPLEMHDRYRQIEAADLATIRTFIEATDHKTRLDAANRLGLYENIDEYNVLTSELTASFNRGETHYLSPQPVYRWTSYHWEAPVAQARTYIEIPNGPLSAPAGVDWLRLPDKLGKRGNYHQLTKTWKGAFAQWNRNVYPSA